jgi:hypothetical protein
VFIKLLHPANRRDPVVGVHPGKGGEDVAERLEERAVGGARDGSEDLGVLDLEGVVVDDAG